VGEVIVSIRVKDYIFYFVFRHIAVRDVLNVAVRIVVVIPVDEEFYRELPRPLGFILPLLPDFITVFQGIYFAEQSVVL